MNAGIKTALAVAALVVSGGAYYLLAPACACVTPDQKAHAQINDDITRVVQAAQAIRGRVGHYPATVEMLGVQAAPRASEIVLSNVTDVGFHLEARSTLPGITCTLDVTVQTTMNTRPTCSGHVSNH